MPNRDNLIAMGLMALAFGLMVGVAIGPALGNSSNAGATVAAVPPATVAETPATDDTVAVADSPTLSAPAGSESLGSTSDSGSDGTTTASTGDGSFDDPAASPDPAPADPAPDDSVAPEKEKNDPEDVPKSLPGSALEGTVVGLGTNEKSYALADESGNVLAMHAASSPPLAASVSTRIVPLDNGTFGEALDWSAHGEKDTSVLRGVVSYIDPETGWIAISNRGASIAVDAAEVLAAGDFPAEVGSYVEGKVSFPIDLRGDPDSGPLAKAVSLEAIGDPGEIIELNGRLLTFDPEAGLMTIAPDSGGRISDEIQIKTPEDLDESLPAVGRTFNASAEIGDDGELLLTGLSADYNRKVAEDVSTAYGDHRRS